ncbi:hypothetical protein [Haladaptatus salinisoli]|uniref:hypothetical protein n=1 Tax=Haladaptatus salinisoli TaxID=2884876 RepID=UPI001D0AB0F1|nr:hypothetical protein [Haladaptatus salinisoli]
MTRGGKRRGPDFSPSDREVRSGVVVGSTTVFRLSVAVTRFASGGEPSPIDFLSGVSSLLPIVIATGNLP